MQGPLKNHHHVHHQRGVSNRWTGQNLHSRSKGNSEGLRWAWPPHGDRPTLLRTGCVQFLAGTSAPPPASSAAVSPGHAAMLLKTRPAPRPPGADSLTPVSLPTLQPWLPFSRTTTTTRGWGCTCSSQRLLITGGTRGTNYGHKKHEITQCAPRHYPTCH